MAREDIDLGFLRHQLVDPRHPTGRAPIEQLPPYAASSTRIREVTAGWNGPSGLAASAMQIRRAIRRRT
ncbi:hypothetical protein C2U35_10465 [Ralstonia solanacearum]|nr:hypothetical protein C2U35_10465 [Ralstonia solanacearum]